MMPEELMCGHESRPMCGSARTAQLGSADPPRREHVAARQVGRTGSSDSEKGRGHLACIALTTARGGMTVDGTAGLLDAPCALQKLHLHLFAKHSALWLCSRFVPCGTAPSLSLQGASGRGVVLI